MVDVVIDNDLVAGQSGLSVPLIVSVAGHRNLVASEESGIRRCARGFLTWMQDEFPERGISVVSSLAEGADQLVAEEALDLGLSLVAVLPMPLELYATDFGNEDSQLRFRTLLEQAVEVFELPLLPGASADTVAIAGRARDMQYAQLGVFLCAHCQVLLAVWDGKYREVTGGTGQVVRFHHGDRMYGYTSTNDPTRLILSDDESDLVYHIVCSRDEPDGAPAPGLEALSCAWFTTSETDPRVPDMPQRHRRVFDLTTDFCRDAELFREQIIARADQLASAETLATLPSGLRDINKIFASADWLALHFRACWRGGLVATHAMAFLMGFMYILYSDYDAQRSFLIAFAAFFLGAFAAHRIEVRLQWHRKYLDYRALAEGLRVEFYWAVAGVVSPSVSKYAHDDFLQMQDGDLGWIRNVMRAAGMESNMLTHVDAKGVEIAIQQWVGDDNSGQYQYYTERARSKLDAHRRMQQFGAVLLWSAAVVFGLFTFAGDDLANRIRDPAVVLMGVALLTFGLWRSYGFSLANFELIKQYEFMSRAFARARQHIAACDNDAERRHVLLILGETALEEHAGWLNKNRERASDEQELWGVGK